MTNRLTTAQLEEHWQVMSFHARSFRWAAAFLRASHRERVAALYAFCRTVDDLADGEWSSPESRHDLEQICEALDAEPGAEAKWPKHYLWFRGLCVESGIDFQVVRELMNGMVADLSLVRIENDRELIRYCYRAAGTVGLMMCSVFGVTDRRAQRHAIDLGIAMQLTNICRDVLEDADAARVYLPAERLKPYGVTPEQLVRGVADPEGVSLVVSEMLEMAESYYQSGDEGMVFLPRRARWAVLIASRLYRAIGRRLRRTQASNPLLGRVVVPWFAKVREVGAATLSWIRLSFRSKRPRRPSRLHQHLQGLPYVSVPPPPPKLAAPEVGAGGQVVPAEVSRVGHAVGHTH
ncbi:MAG: phytoene/squalene synthase family protein [Myxococcota bacterium]